MTWVESITVDGASTPLAEWLAYATIRHGRAAVMDEPTASTADLFVNEPTRSFVRDLEVGAELAVDLTGGLPRFRGRITDLELSDPELHVIAVGRLADLKRHSTSTVNWPAEPWSARVTRMLQACEVADYLVVADPDWDPVVEPPPEAEIAAEGYVSELADTVGAAVYDDEAGRIVFDALGARLDPARVTVPLDPANVAYSPLWVQELDVSNRVTVYYGPNRDTSVTVSHAESVARYGPHRTEIYTTLSDPADATLRAEQRLLARAWGYWQVQPISLLQVPADTFTIGTRVELTELPASSPYASWSPVLEGYADLIDGPGFGMQLFVSDPLASGIGAYWKDAGPGFRWVDFDPTLAWKDVSQVQDIGGSRDA